MTRIAFLASMLTLWAAASNGAEYNGRFPKHDAKAPSAQRLIVKWHSGEAERAKSSALKQYASKTGRSLKHERTLAPSLDLLALPERLSGAALEASIRALQADPSVEYVSPDLRRHIHAQPSDPLLSQQWYFLSNEAAATRAELAWDVTVGSSSTIVAVLDTGVLFDHPDLLRVADGGKLLDGYDFISSPEVANDGSSRDADATDPGDWVDGNDTHPAFDDCTFSSSSWHGTRVASLIAAITDNGQGIAGTGWETLVLPVRVLGKCGGFDSDIISAMRWAAGLSVTGVPANPTPAHIINLSLGGGGVCTSAYQAAVNEIIAAGTLIVASVGNEGTAVSAPANCEGVLGVTGLRHAGTKVGFSNLGRAAGIGAPGGNCVNTGAGQPCLFSIIVASDTGQTTAQTRTYTDQFNFNVGTSFSAPLVAGAAALMHSVNSSLTPPQYIAALKATANPFATSSTTTTTVCRVPLNFADIQNTECICTTSTCGAGMLNTQAAVMAAQGPFASIEADALIEPGIEVVLDGRQSFAADGRTIASYQWSILDGSGSTPAIANATQALTSLQVAGASEFTLRLTITDNEGSQDTADLLMSTADDPDPSPAPTPVPPISGGGGGGGGGTLGWELLLLGLLGRRRKG